MTSLSPGWPREKIMTSPSLAGPAKIRSYHRPARPDARNKSPIPARPGRAGEKNKAVPPAGRPGLLMAMGPGFCSELVLLRWR